MALILASFPAFSLDPKTEALDRWNAYIKEVDTRNQQRIVAGQSFLATDVIPGRATELRAGTSLCRVPAG